MKTAAVNVRIEHQLKAEAEEVLLRLGLTPTEAIRLFYAEICRTEGLPFVIAIPNELTRQTLKKSQRAEDTEEFENLEDMLASWRE